MVWELFRLYGFYIFEGFVLLFREIRVQGVVPRGIRICVLGFLGGLGFFGVFSEGFSVFLGFRV